MHPPVRRFKLSGRIAPDDLAHRVQAAAADVLAPSYVSIPGVGNVPQYAATVATALVCYDPARDCNGYFMSSKFQPNNNCYNYSCDIATNSFAQPGRRHGYLIPQPTTGAGVQAGAEKDGLIFVGSTISDIQKRAASADGGHYVALLISSPDTAAGWPGDYHWVRCDDNANFHSWSQKDGPDQVTNFDFAGNPIADPASSNWTVNQGPISDQNPNDLQATYDFYGYMYVPWGKVDII
ncbi:MAG: hypothetical protein ABSA78_03400 [Candidatus Sulfotelmatobacter sp.]|jgi:hypothetical protein